MLVCYRVLHMSEEHMSEEGLKKGVQMSEERPKNSYGVLFRCLKKGQQDV
jgi:hypothetical protein